MPKPNAVTFGCSTCKGEVKITHLVFHEGELWLVGYCQGCNGEQVNFKLDSMIARLTGVVLAPRPRATQ